jgi:hypothetical protein
VTGVQTCALPISPKPQNPIKLIRILSYKENNQMLRKFVGACLASFALAHETEMFPTDAHVAEANGWNSVQVTVDGK